MKVGVKISGISSSLTADAVVALSDRIEREEERWLERLRSLRRPPVAVRDRRYARDESDRRRS